MQAAQGTCFLYQHHPSEENQQDISPGRTHSPAESFLVLTDPSEKVQGLSIFVTDCNLTPLKSQDIKSLTFSFFNLAQMKNCISWVSQTFSPPPSSPPPPPHRPVSSSPGVKFPSPVSWPYFFSPQGTVRVLWALYITVHAWIHTAVSAIVASIHFGF